MKKINILGNLRKVVNSNTWKQTGTEKARHNNSSIKKSSSNNKTSKPKGKNNAWKQTGTEKARHNNSTKKSSSNNKKSRPKGKNNAWKQTGTEKARHKNSSGKSVSIKKKNPKSKGKNRKKSNKAWKQTGTERARHNNSNTVKTNARRISKGVSIVSINKNISYSTNPVAAKVYENVASGFMRNGSNKPKNRANNKSNSFSSRLKSLLGNNNIGGNSAQSRVTSTNSRKTNNFRSLLSNVKSFLKFGNNIGGNSTQSRVTSTNSSNIGNFSSILGNIKKIVTYGNNIGGNSAQSRVSSSNSSSSNGKVGILSMVRTILGKGSASSSGSTSNGVSGLVGGKIVSLKDLIIPTCYAGETKKENNTSTKNQTNNIDPTKPWIYSMLPKTFNRDRIEINENSNNWVYNSALKNIKYNGIPLNIRYTKDKKKKYDYLFPNGKPKSSKEMTAKDKNGNYIYLTDVKVPIWEEYKENDVVHYRPRYAYIRIHKDLAKDVKEVFEDVFYKSDFKITDVGGGIDPTGKIPNTYLVGGYGWRENGPKSDHSLGVAIDINVPHNCKMNEYGECEKGKYDPEHDDLAIEETDLLVQELKDRGWKWGAEFETAPPDYMHFSFPGN